MNPAMLIIDDDPSFNAILVRTLERRGHPACGALDPQAAIAKAREIEPEQVILDLNLNGSSGLALIPQLLEIVPDCRIVVLTGYASIATAVEAVKLGACHYLAKPSNTDDIEAAFGRVEGRTDVEVSNHTTSIKTLEWEHIHETLAESGFNISEAARRLGMHRRTLARKLEKRQVK